MLIEAGSHLYVYVISRDFGFAPNPFHGICTLATCKPKIRNSANVGDWIMGVGGNALGEARGKCILLMKVSEKIGFQDYWNDEQYALKKAIRNGSDVRMLGDNIYHKDEGTEWIQEDSHHSNSDGSINYVNLKRDTGQSDRVLISRYFLYFGSEAQEVDLDSINYKRGIGHKKICLSDSEETCNLITSIFRKNKNEINIIISDPCQFEDAHKRVDQGSGKIL